MDVGSDMRPGGGGGACPWGSRVDAEGARGPPTVL